MLPESPRHLHSVTIALRRVQVVLANDMLGLQRILGNGVHSRVVIVPTAMPLAVEFR